MNADVKSRVRVRVAVCVAVAGFLCAASASMATVLASYPFTGGTAASQDVDVATVASSFTFGSFTGGTTEGNVAVSSSTNNAYIRAAASSDTTAAAAVANDDSWGFILTPEAGVTVNLTALNFKVGSNAVGTSTSFTSNYVVRSSVDGYAADLGTGTYSKTTTGTNGSFTSLLTIDLSGLAAFQNLTGPVTFKFFEFDSSIASGDIARLDDISLEGTVPEPGALSVLLIGSAMLMVRRRR